MVQQSTDPFYYQRPLADRAEVAFTLVTSTINSAPALMQLALGESITSAQATSLVDTNGRTILHTLAFKLAIETWRIVRGDAFGNCDIRDGKFIVKTLENELLTPDRLEGLPKEYTCIETEPALYIISTANAVFGACHRLPRLGRFGRGCCSNDPTSMA